MWLILPGLIEPDFGKILTAAVENSRWAEVWKRVPFNTHESVLTLLLLNFHIYI
jgi:hypothetical protein